MKWPERWCWALALGLSEAYRHGVTVQVRDAVVVLWLLLGPFVLAFGIARWLAE